MSVANAKELIQKLSGNDTLKAKFKTAGERGFEKLAASEGCPCTLDEFNQAIKESAQDLDLKKEAGGQVQAVVVVSIAVV